MFELKFRYFFPQEQQDTFPLEKVLKVAEAERQLGNFLYRKRNLERARDVYKKVWHQKEVLSIVKSCESRG